MGNYLTVEEYAKQKGLSDRRIRYLLEQGRIEGADRPGHEWRIPKGAPVLAPLTRNSLKGLFRVRRFGPSPVIVGVYNQAGGSGKTSLVRDLGFLAGQWGLRVLLVDLDAQANLTSWLGIRRKVELKETVHDAILGGTNIPTPIETYGLDLIPSCLEMDSLNGQLYGKPHFQLRLKELLPRLPYDLILLDGPPNITPMVSSMIMAVQHLVVPVEVDRKGLEGLRGVMRIISEFRSVGAIARPTVHVPTRFDARSSEARQYLEELQAAGGMTVTSPIHLRSAPYIAATTQGKPLPYVQPSSEATSDLLKLAPVVLTALGLEVEDGNREG